MEQQNPQQPYQPQYQQPYAPQMQNRYTYQPQPKKKPGRAANFFLSLLPLVSFLAVQTLLSVLVFFMVFLADIFQSGRKLEVMATHEELLSISIPIAMTLTHLVSAVGFAFWYRLSIQKPRPALRETAQKLKPEPIIMALVLGILMSVFSSGTSGLASLLFPDMAKSSGIGTNHMGIFATVLLAPIGEELIFRGLTMKYAEKAFGRFWAANLLQAFLFGVAHMNWVQGVSAFFGGLVLGWIAHHDQSIVFAMIMHFAVNIFSTFGGNYALSRLPLNVISVTLMLVLPAAAAIALLAWRNHTARKAVSGAVPPVMPPQ